MEVKYLNINKYRLNANELSPEINLGKMRFKTTKNLKTHSEIVGQKRAQNSLDFGIKMKSKGYNIYVTGSPGTGRNSYIESVLNEYAKKNFKKEKLRDYIYVYNFKNRYQPIVIEFPIGMGKNFKADMEDMIEKISSEINKKFTSIRYGNNTMKMDFELEDKIDSFLDELNEKAESEKMYFQIGPNGLICLPLDDDLNPMTPEMMEEISDEEIAQFKKNQNKLRRHVSRALDNFRKAEEEFTTRLEDYDIDLVSNIIDSVQKDYIKKYLDIEKVKEYLFDIKEDIIKNLNKFKPSANKGKIIFSARGEISSFFKRYEVNLFLDNSDKTSLPVVKLTNPTYYELNGYYEYKNKMGTYSANFTDIISGAFHKANGGFLVLNVKDVLQNPYSWEQIKRVLKNGKVEIDSLSQYSSYIVTSSIKPEPIDVNLKVILIGDYESYNLLYEYDEDFEKLFKVLVEFDTNMEKTDENVEKYVRAIALQQQNRNIRPFTKSAVIQILKYSSRLAEDKNMLTAQFSKILEIMLESDAIADINNEFIDKDDIINCMKHKKYRNGQYEDFISKMYDNGTLLIDVSSKKVGQINALVVISEGENSFGLPVKMTASSYMGKDGILNVERETKLTGATHDKGMMILSGYFGERYAKEDSLSFTSSITFEQNYGYIDGDSASSTELYLMFSSLGNIPIRCDIAVTGSVSQKGEIQPIGGVNEKIEGFYNICKRKGLTSTQGVIIPKLNVQNLVLSDEVIESCKENKFHIYAISTVDEGLEILTGLSKKEIDQKMEKELEKYRDTDEDE